jgi:hypothetical protein
MATTTTTRQTRSTTSISSQFVMRLPHVFYMVKQK